MKAVAPGVVYESWTILKGLVCGLFFGAGGDVVAVNILLGGGDVCYSCGRNILI